jgi:hypothetical protein
MICEVVYPVVKLLLGQKGIQGIEREEEIRA